MAANLVDLVKIKALSTGTGAISLGDAVAGYRGKEALSNGGVYSYAIQQGSEFELGQGTYLAATNSFVRAPRYSSDGGVAINLSSNAAVAFVLLTEDLATKIFDSTALDSEVQRAASAEAFLASRINSAAAGMATYATAADLPASPAPADGTQARVYADASASNNGVWIYTSGAWAFDADFYGQLSSGVQDRIDGATAPLTDYTAGPAPLAATGTAFSQASFYAWAEALKSYPQYITKFVFPASSGGKVKLAICHVEDDGSLSFVSSQDFVAVVGVNSFAPNIALAAGDVPGIVANDAGGYYDNVTPSGKTLWSTAAVPTDHTAKTASTNIDVKFSFDLVGDVRGEASLAYQTANAANTAIGGETYLFWPDPIVATGDDTPDGYTIISQLPASADGIVGEVEIGVAAAGTASIVVVEMDGLNSHTVSSTPLALAAGSHIYDLPIPIAAGQFTGIVGGNYKFQNNSNPEGIPVWIKGSALNADDTLTSSTSHRYEVSFTLKTGLYAQKAAGGVSGTGLDVLETASGDITDALAVAKAAHPFPYIRPGTFTATAVPDDGQGLWGPGDLIVDGVSMSLPSAPESAARFLALRAALMGVIATHSALIINGNSISNTAYASSPHNNYVGRLTRFANLGIAIDEAVFVNFDDSDPSSWSGVSGGGTGLVFHGISLSSPSTATNGSAGPVSKSLMLQPGQVMTLDAAAYSRIDVTYQGGAGRELTFAFNGSAYKTVTCATSGNDVLANAGNTGQTASGSYTIASTGSAAVEITALIRQGIKADGSPPRLNVCRFAHGGYEFQHYGAAQIASMMRIATAVGGGSDHFLITELGTNDSVGGGLNYAEMKAAVGTYVTAWIAAGVDVEHMMPIAPWRWSSYPSTTSYEEALAGVRDGFREQGVRRIAQTDARDLIAEGLTTTGDGHPSDEGHRAVFNAVVAALCAPAL